MQEEQLRKESVKISDIYFQKSQTLESEDMPEQAF